MRRAQRVGRRIRTLTLSAIAWGFVIAPVGAQEQPLRLVSGPDYPPFSDPELPAGGMLTEIVGAAFAAAGMPMAPVRFEPWKRGYASVLALRADATFPYVWTPERAEEVVFSDILYDAHAVAVFPATSPHDYASPESLRGLVMCVPLGFAVNTAIEPLVKSGAVQVRQNADVEGCLRQMLVGRIDVFVGEEIMVAQTMRLRFGGEAAFKRGSVPVKQIPHYLIVGKANPRAAAILEAFNRGLEQVRADGRWQEIVSRHLAGPS